MSMMPTTLDDPQGVVVGVDTHQRTHHATAITTRGQRLGDHEFPATSAGYDDLMAWAGSFGPLAAVGVESTGAYGAGLTRALLVAGVEVYEVARAERHARYLHGKSDPIDAESAARQVLAGTARGRAKIKTGIIEAIRMIKIPRDSAVKDRTRAYSQLRDLATTAPEAIREELLPLTGPARVTKAAAFRPDASRLSEPTQMTKHVLRTLARRIQALDAEIAEADRLLEPLVAQAVPTLLALPQVGIQTAAQLAITAGQNIDRMRSEAAFAKLTGTAPIPASSGKNAARMRLNRGGDRHANAALYMIVIGRMRNHQPTRDYLQRRSTENLTKRDLIRCLKRYTAREAYHALRTDLMTLDRS